MRRPRENLTPYPACREGKYAGKRLPTKLRLASLLVAALLASTLSSVVAQTPRTPVPLVTLVPPTPLPPPPTATPRPPLIQSALARIKADPPHVVIGIPYNISRFATLTITGEVEGFEADIAQAIADDWGVKLSLKQVTRQNALDLLLSGQIDLLMGQVILSRDEAKQAMLDFSDAIFASRQVALARENTIGDIKDLGGKTVGVVVGSRAEEAYNAWAAASGVQATVKRYAMIDEGIRALVNQQIDVLAGDRWELHERVAGIVFGVTLLPTPFRVEPYAIAMRRYDDNLRTLVNRTLQRLVKSQRLDPIYAQWFPNNLLPVSDRVIPRVWNNLDDDSRALADFSTDIVMPSQPVVARIKAKQPLRVAGLGALPGPNGKQPALEALNQALINEMARRWGVPVQQVQGSFGKGEDMIASGQADIAVGLEPHWGTVDRIDFAAIYALHGYRLMTPFGSSLITDFKDFFATNRQFAYFADDPDALELAKKEFEKVRIPLDTIKPMRLQVDNDAIQVLVTDRTANAVFGDSLRLWPIVQANPKFVQLTEKTYPTGGTKPISFGVPRNDADFRVLVEITLQDMYKDGTYQKIWTDTFGFGDPLTITVWPGPSTLFGIKTSG
jgi:polar amino acid transport system substrate-binding protein